MVKNWNKKLNYDETREEIHKILTEFFLHEIDLRQKCGEFDFEFMEFTTDHILTLIRRQGGDTST